jgi:hypothetical protein
MIWICFVVVGLPPRNGAPHSIHAAAKCNQIIALHQIPQDLWQLRKATAH